MALEPIQNCTRVTGDPNSLPVCTRDISSSLDQYPSYFTCNRAEDAKVCYAIQNYDDSANTTTYVRSGFLKAMETCCTIGGPGSSQSCVNFCTTDNSLSSFNSCLAQYGYGPTYSDSGVVRDTYCVPSLDAQDDGAIIEDKGTLNSGAIDLQRQANRKATIALGVLVFVSAWI